MYTIMYGSLFFTAKKNLVFERVKDNSQCENYLQNCFSIKINANQMDQPSTANGTWSTRCLNKCDWMTINWYINTNQLMNNNISSKNNSPCDFHKEKTNYFTFFSGDFHKVKQNLFQNLFSSCDFHKEEITFFEPFKLKLSPGSKKPPYNCK